MNHYNSETRLLLLLSRVGRVDSCYESAQTIINSGINWQAFLDLSINQDTSNLIYKNLLKLKEIPDDVIGRFQNIYYSTVRSNILKINELDRIIDALGGAGVEVISLKGAVASEKIFNDIGLYPSSDIDILIKTEDIDGSRDVFMEMGYELVDKEFDRYRDYYLQEGYHSVFSNGILCVEPHWNLFFRYFTTPPEFWWKESIIISSERHRYRVLSPEKDVLYNSFRLFSKSFNVLRFLVIIAETLRYYADDIDWEKLLFYARLYKFENVLRVVMRMTEELLGAPVPGEYCRFNNLRTGLLYRHACKLIMEGEVLHNPLSKGLLIFLRDDFRGALMVISRRIFPSMGEIVSRYRLPAGSKKAYIYYVLNPLFLIMRKHQKQ